MVDTRKGAPRGVAKTSSACANKRPLSSTSVGSGCAGGLRSPNLSMTEGWARVGSAVRRGVKVALANHPEFYGVAAGIGAACVQGGAVCEDRGGPCDCSRFAARPRWASGAVDFPRGDSRYSLVVSWRPRGRCSRLAPRRSILGCIATNPPHRGSPRLRPGAQENTTLWSGRKKR